MKIDEPTDCTRAQWVAWYRKLSQSERWCLAMTRAKAWECDAYGRVQTQPQGRYTASGVQIVGHDPMTAHGKLATLIGNNLDMTRREIAFRDELRMARSTED